MSNPVKRKLSSELIPYFISADKLRSWKPLWIYTLHRYLNEVFVLLIGLGFSHPILTFLSNFGVAESQSGKGPTVTSVLSPTWLLVLATVCLVLWGLLKFYIKTTNLEARCALTQSCRRHFRHLQLQLVRCLSEPNPISKLTEIQEKIYEIVDRSIVEDAWPFNPIAPKISEEVKKKVDELVTRFGDRWSVPDDEELLRNGEL